MLLFTSCPATPECCKVLAESFRLAGMKLIDFAAFTGSSLPPVGRRQPYCVVNLTCGIFTGRTCPVLLDFSA